MQDFRELPQELVNHIISYVPEYGFLVNLELHELSLEVQEASAYCDFYRFAARSVLDRFDTCTEIYDAIIDEAERDIAARYLSKYLRDLLCRYLNDKDSVPVFLLEQLGIKSASYLTEVKYIDGGGYVVYQQVSYRAKIIRFYSLIILYDSGIIGKKEFEHRCREFSDIRLLLEIIMVAFLNNDHIYNIVIRYFPSLMEDVIGRLENKCAVVQEIIYEDAYRFSIESIRERLSCKKL